jgi:hypothetical protein
MVFDLPCHVTTETKSMGMVVHATVQLSLDSRVLAALRTLKMYVLAKNLKK